jgi:hypothetical protein
MPVCGMGFYDSNPKVLPPEGPALFWLDIGRASPFGDHIIFSPLILAFPACYFSFFLCHPWRSRPIWGETFMVGIMKIKEKRRRISPISSNQFIQVQDYSLRSLYPATLPGAVKAFGEQAGPSETMSGLPRSQHSTLPQF